jgi:hypothetical protein
MLPIIIIIIITEQHLFPVYSASLGGLTYECALQQSIVQPVLPYQYGNALEQTLILCSHFM